MGSKTRLANKTLWALEDITGACLAARRELDELIRRSERHMDARLMAAVARLSQRIAEVEELARDARQGKYNGR